MGYRGPKGGRSEELAKRLAYRNEKLMLSAARSMMRRPVLAKSQNTVREKQMKLNIAFATRRTLDDLKIGKKSPLRERVHKGTQDYAKLVADLGREYPQGIPRSIIKDRVVKQVRKVKDIVRKGAGSEVSSKFWKTLVDYGDALELSHRRGALKGKN